MQARTLRRQLCSHLYSSARSNACIRYDATPLSGGSKEVTSSRITTLQKLAILALLCAASASASAQGTSAISGRVLDSDRAPVAEAIVTALRGDRSVAREITTGEGGAFRVAPLSAGIYTVIVRKIGFRSA